MNKIPVMRPLSLAFEGPTEKEFLLQYFRRSVNHVRIALILGSLVYCMFGFLDALMLPEIKWRLWAIRYGIFLPLVSGLFMFSFSTSFRKYWQPAMALLFLLIGLSTVWMIHLAPPPLNIAYYAGMIVVLIYGFTVFKLRFIWASLAGFLIIFCYEVVALKFTSIPSKDIVSNNFFILAATVGAMLACYSMEYYSRQAFWRSRLLEKEKRETEASNILLKQEIQERIRIEEELMDSRVQLEEKIRLIDELYEHIIQMNKSQAISEHTAEVAHELRQPLAVIGGFVRRMSKQLGASAIADLQAQQREFFPIILNEVERLERILGRLIDFTHRDEVTRQIVDLKKLLSEIISEQQNQISEKELILELHISPDLPFVSVDSDKFYQILRNLVSNAVEASPVGGIIHISGGEFVPTHKERDTAQLSDDNLFEFKIRNQGPVISSDELKKLFDPFYISKTYGTGIGLMIVKRLVEDHRGSLSVRSDLEGTVFTLWLPMNINPLLQRRLQNTIS